jgi:hypothetical protein
MPSAIARLLVSSAGLVEPQLRHDACGVSS